MPCPRFRAFSLLEVILVLGLILLAAFFACTEISKVVVADAVTSGAQLVSDCLAEGRQDAIQQNLPVEVRIYASTPASYDAMQLRWRDTDGTTPPAAPLVLLPSGVLIDATAAHSTLVAVNGEKPAADPTDPRLNALTRCFHFLTDGSTDLAIGTTWTLTVRPASASDPAHFPANWACLQVDPTTGRAQLYRP